MKARHIAVYLTVISGCAGPSDGHRIAVRSDYPLVVLRSAGPPKDLSNAQVRGKPPERALEDLPFVLGRIPGLNGEKVSQIVFQGDSLFPRPYTFKMPSGGTQVDVIAGMAWITLIVSGTNWVLTDLGKFSHSRGESNETTDA
jgi:hypothetical protein